MKLHSLLFRTSLFVPAALFTSGLLASVVYAQQQGDPDSDAAVSAKFPAAKRRAAEASSARDTSQDSKKALKPEKDSADTIRKREAWFYKQRASANGHIPAGARGRALQHMQRMMVAEGKLVQRPDGSFAEVGPSSNPTPLAPGTGTWSSIGPTPTTGGFFSPVTGRITAIAVDPSDATGNTVLIGGALGGIWRTTDGGTTWTAVGDQNVSLAMGSIAFAPSACAASPGACTVYAATGEQASVGFDIYYGEGVLKSTDHGQTWTQTCTVASATCPFIGPYQDVTPFGYFTLGGTRISYVAVNPSNPQMVLVAAQTQFSHGSTEGVYCSADGGSSWNIVPTASGDMATFVGFASSTVAFAALGSTFGSATNGNGIFQSTTASSCALTFTKLSTGLPAASTMGRIDLGISPLYAATTNPDSTVYASIADASTGSSTNLGVFVTNNGGTSWTQTGAPDVCQFQCWYDNVVKVDPNGKNFAFFGGSSVLDPTFVNPGYVIRTTNGGTSWSTVIPNLPGGSPGFPHVDNHAIAFAKLSTGKIRMYLGNDGGIWRTDDAEAATLPLTWTNLNDSLLTLTQFYPALSIHPSSPGIAFAGTQDNGSQIYDQAVNGSVWTDSNTCGDGTGTAIDNVIPSTVFVACNGVNIGVSYTNGAPGSYFLAVNGINPLDHSNFVPPLITDPGTANTAYLGTTKVYQTLTGDLSWTALSSDLVNGATGDSLIALAVAPTNPAVVYAGADTGAVFIATNVSAGTGTFNAVAGQASLPPRQVSAIAVDPADATGKTAYAAFSGFSFVQGTINDPKGHLFKTTDGGATWTDVSCTVADCQSPGATDLPNTPVNDVVVDPDIPGTLYVGTDIGVFQGICTTTCAWSTLGTGLPRVAVLSLKLHRASRTLRAATHGRGAWDLNLGGQAAFGITSISPFTANAGASATTLTVNGNGFLSTSNIKFTINGSSTTLTPTAPSATQLTATIPTTSLAGGGAASVSVVNGAVSSNSLVFTVLNPVPGITSISPTTATAGSSGLALTVNGSNFLAGTLVMFNLVALPANAVTVTNASTLTVQVPAADLATAQVVTVDTFNPTPGGGVDPNPAPPTLTINNPVPALTSISPNSAAPGGQAFTLMLTGSNFNASSLVSFNGNPRATTFVSSTQLTASILASDIAAAGTDPVTVNNPAPGGGTSASVTFTVASSGSFTVSGAAVTVMAGASGMSAITVTPTGGFTGMVNVTCAAANLPPGVTCTPNPLAINVTGTTAVTGNLTVAVAAPSSTTSASVLPTDRRVQWAGLPPITSGAKGWRGLSAITGLAAILLLLLPGRKRYRAALALGLICILSFTLGCSGGYGGGGGTSATTTKISVMSTKVASGTSVAFNVTVTSTGTRMPTGSVQLYDGTAVLGTAGTLASGSTTINISSLAVGTHAISAHYLADAYSTASQSGVLNIAITGTTTFAITASPAASNGNATVNLTIN